MNKPTITSALLLISTTLLASACSSHQPGQDQLVQQDKHEAIATKPMPIIPEPAETDTLADVNLPDPNLADSNLPAPNPAHLNVTDTSAYVTSSEPEEAAQDILALEDSVTPNDEAVAASLDSDSDDNTRPAQTLFLFGFDQKQLNPEAELLLRQHGRFLAAHPDLKISVNGHSDAQGNPAYNQHLSRQRAEYVAKLLAEEGVDNEQMQVMSWGADLPVTAATHNRDNRRVELIYDASLLVNYHSE